jgi:hypothetical protein
MSQKIKPPIGMVGTMWEKRSVAAFIFARYKLSLLPGPQGMAPPSTGAKDERTTPSRFFP